MTTKDLKTHLLFARRDGDRLIDFQGAEGQRTDPRAVAIEILRDRGRYQPGSYVVVEHDWVYDLPGFEAEYGSDYDLTSQVLAQIKVVEVAIGRADFR